MSKQVLVRIAIAVNEKGQYEARGWSDSDAHKYTHSTAPMDHAIESLPRAIGHTSGHWVSVWVSLPSCAEHTAEAEE